MADAKVDGEGKRVVCAEVAIDWMCVYDDKGSKSDGHSQKKQDRPMRACVPKATNSFCRSIHSGREARVSSRQGALGDERERRRLRGGEACQSQAPDTTSFLARLVETDVFTVHLLILVGLHACPVHDEGGHHVFKSK